MRGGTERTQNRELSEGFVTIAGFVTHSIAGDRRGGHWFSHAQTTRPPRSARNEGGGYQWCAKSAVTVTVTADARTSVLQAAGEGRA